MMHWCRSVITNEDQKLRDAHSWCDLVRDVQRYRSVNSTLRYRNGS